MQVIGVDILDLRPEAKAFMQEFGMTFPSVFDPPAAMHDMLGHLGRPVTFFYRADGAFSFAWDGSNPRRHVVRTP